MLTKLWIILVLGVGTYLIRAGSLSLGSRVSWSEGTRRWLSYVSPAVLGALLGPMLLMQDNKWVPIIENKMLLAALPAILVAWKSRHLLWTVVAGIVSYAAVYYLL